MANHIKIKKGLDIPLQGKASGTTADDRESALFAITPDDFPGCTWKAVVKAGDSVAHGSPLLIDKASGTITLTSPVDGTVKEIHRGERRKIEFVSVEKGVCTDKADFNTSTEREQIRTTLQASGLWAMMRQRPFDIVPEAESTPRDIFVTAFDSAPLAPAILEDSLASYLEKGLEILKRLTDGYVYLGVRAGSGITSRVAEVYEFEGPHPAGNVGTQIAAIDPVNKGETVWTLDAETAARIGKLYTDGNLDFSTVVAVTGPEAKSPHSVRTIIGASLKTLLKGAVAGNDTRIISGNVLTGVKETADGFLRYPYRQITLIQEGEHADEFMGWASMNPRKFSVKHTFPAFLRGLTKPYDFDSRIKGGHRAMILSGEYDKVFPMDIYPEYLLKAILAGDIDKMEKLGIYEVAPEDFALPEFVDTSKNELQKIVREGLDNLRKELS